MYTFDVYWEESDISWASRWDAYLNMPGGRVHWFSILNSLMVVLVMSSIVAMIMMRTIRRDLQRYEGLLGDAGIALLLLLPVSDGFPSMRLCTAHSLHDFQIDCLTCLQSAGLCLHRHSGHVCVCVVQAMTWKKVAGRWCLEMCSDHPRTPFTCASRLAAVSKLSLQRLQPSSLLHLVSAHLAMEP